MRICVGGVMALALISSGRNVQAEEGTQDGGIGVTLESCGDVNAEDVQEALALEYRGGLLGTMVTVVCGEDSATLSVVGPSNPKGRIVLIDLTRVSAIAMPRTIALLASELWTAPEPDPAIQISSSHALSDGSISPVSRPEFGQEEARRFPSLQESYRTGGTFGFALGLEGRTIERASVGYGEPKEYLSWTLSAEWAARPNFGFFAELSHANSIPENGLGRDQIAIYDRGEMGAYVPVLSGSFRIDMRFGAGYDKQFEPNALKLDYEYLEVGADFLYFMRDNFMVTGRWSYQAILDGSRNTGVAAQMGAIWRLRPFLLEGKWTLSQADIEFRGEGFNKTGLRGELGLRYSF